jgi:hypothetical protein
MNNNEATTSASKIIGLLEDAYRVLQAGTPDLPEVFFKLDHGRRAFSQTWGHFAPEAWTADGKPRHEVMIASECLAAGAEQVLQTLIHEAVHALAEARGVKETSRQGRYHNRKFVALAEELGLTYDCDRNRGADGQLVPDTRIGWSHVVLTPETRTRYMGLLDLLRKEITAYRGSGKFVSAPVRQATHAYAIFWTADGELDIIQLGPSRYERLSSYLTEHYSLTSTMTQAMLTGFLTEYGFPVAGASEYPFYSDGLEHSYPELAVLIAELES